MNDMMIANRIGERDQLLADLMFSLYLLTRNSISLCILKLCELPPSS